MGFSERAQQLKEARMTAEFELRKKAQERREFVRDKVNAYTRIVEDEATQIYGAEIDRLYEAGNVAQRAERAQLNEDAKNGVGAKYPVGSVLREWDQPNWRHNKRDRVLTGKSARYIAITSDTPMPQNSRYSNPDIGEFALQVIKKDGSAGVAFVSRSDSHNYFPEGVDPNTPKPEPTPESEQATAF